MMAKDDDERLLFRQREHWCALFCKPSVVRKLVVRSRGGLGRRTPDISSSFISNMLRSEQEKKVEAASVSSHALYARNTPSFIVVGKAFNDERLFGVSHSASAASKLTLPPVVR
jgi:hypothetical protein